MLRPSHPLRAERGFTLVELIVTVAIAGILIGFTYAGFSGMMSRYRCQGALNRVAQMFKLAQMKAVEQNVNYVIHLNAADGNLTIVFDPDDNSSSINNKAFDEIIFENEYPGVDILPSSNCNGAWFNYRGMLKGSLGCSVKLTSKNQPTETGNGTVVISSMGRIQVVTPEAWKY